ncbi:Vesicular, overexpressed in cancer, prosurvival protein 1 [Fukomys damarensis]|uniref:WW domain binding protein VOPP1 n=1 Tax=Fukomys damarensis TaxID=885580 RepID=A0A091DLK5_FUKDA|nr:Vesicular, overexpressed in cancer, prosurvival protein 1 [Fukomys damarensis]
MPHAGYSILYSAQCRCGAVEGTGAQAPNTETTLLLRSSPDEVLWPERKLLLSRDSHSGLTVLAAGPAPGPRSEMAPSRSSVAVFGCVAYENQQHSEVLVCRSYEDCCGSRCCVRALSIQRLWYFWFLLMMGVLFCCGAGFFIRRRLYPPPLLEEPAFNVSYTRQPPNPTPGAQQPGPPYYTDPGGPGMNPVGNMAMAFQVQPNSPQGCVAYPPPPSYCNTPPPPYEQVVKDKLESSTTASLIGAQQPGPPYYTDPGGPGMNPVGNMAMAFQVQPNSPQGCVAYPPPPSYCNTPPPPYEQVVKDK